MHHVYGLIPIDVRGIYLTYFTILFLKDLYKMENTCVCLNIIEIETFLLRRIEHLSSHMHAHIFIAKKTNESYKIVRF